MNSDDHHIAKFNDFWMFRCPHCCIYITVTKADVACGIFRCGIFKQNGNQLPPHLNKIDCDLLSFKKLIYGCAKPFKFDGITLEKCDYI